ncbi:MAG: fluoride efflux transporter CrcB [Actinomycetota bacterium]|nr:fluoride efflux transporter CrcB [Actinomycetota bacterium]
MTLWLWLAVAAVGGGGAISRFVADALVSGRVGHDFPVGTLAINLTGALVLGLLTGLGARGDLLLLAGTAAIGSYTTFSTWMLESHRLAEDGEARPALLNILVSLLAGFGAAFIGYTIGAQL